MHVRTEKCNRGREREGERERESGRGGGEREREREVGGRKGGSVCVKGVSVGEIHNISQYPLCHTLSGSSP